MSFLAQFKSGYKKSNPNSSQFKNTNVGRVFTGTKRLATKIGRQNVGRSAGMLAGHLNKQLFK